MVSAPAATNVVSHVAISAPVTACVAHPAMIVPPSRNATVPVGAPDPGATTLTVAAMATVCPVTDGFTEDTSDVTVEAGVTVCVRIGDVEPVKLRSPLYTAVIEWPPTPGYATLQAATPPISGCAPQPLMVVAPSVKVAVPEGVPLAGARAVTVAV